MFSVSLRNRNRASRVSDRVAQPANSRVRVVVSHLTGNGKGGFARPTAARGSSVAAIWDRGRTAREDHDLEVEKLDLRSPRS